MSLGWRPELRSNPARRLALGILLILSTGPACAGSGSSNALPLRPEDVRTAEETGVLRSNLGLLESLTAAAVAQAADSLNLAPSCSLLVVSTRTHEANWFVANLMAEALARRGHCVRVVEVAPSPAVNGNAGAAQPAGGPARPGGAAPSLRPRPSGTGAERAAGDTTGAYADSVAAAQALEDPLWGQTGEGGTGEEGAPGAEGGPEGAPAESAGQNPPPNQAATPAGAAAAMPAGPVVLPAGNLVDVRVMEFGITYADVSRVLLFGPMRFTRVAGVCLQVSNLRGPSGETRRVVVAERHKVDRLSGSERALVEGASYPFTQPPLKAPSLGRYVEPAVVVAIVASLVYLFYQNQN